jgi:hypothetical protein
MRGFVHRHPTVMCFGTQEGDRHHLMNETRHPQKQRGLAPTEPVPPSWQTLRLIDLAVLPRIVPTCPTAPFLRIIYSVIVPYISAIHPKVRYLCNGYRHLQFQANPGLPAFAWRCIAGLYYPRYHTGAPRQAFGIKIIVFKHLTKHSKI